MRMTKGGLACLAVAMLTAAPAFAAGSDTASPKDEQFAPLGPNDEVVPVVAPGEEIGIACDALQVTAPENDVRVVLTISSMPSEKPAPGYKKVLATNEELVKGAVRVTIPKVPDLRDRLVNVNVYVVNGEDAKGCDAGHMKIANRLQHPKRKQS